MSLYVFHFVFQSHQLLIRRHDTGLPTLSWSPQSQLSIYDSYPPALSATSCATCCSPLATSRARPELIIHIHIWMRFLVNSYIHQQRCWSFVLGCNVHSTRGVHQEAV